MKYYLKLLLSLLLALVIIFNAVACGLNSNNSGGSDSEQGGSVIDPSGDNIGNGSDENNGEIGENDGNTPDKGDTDGDITDKPDDPNDGNDGSGSGSNGGNDGAFDGTDDPLFPNEEEEYVFGSEYADLIIPVSEALEKAEAYTSSASSEIYYILVEIYDIVSLSKGTMYVADDTGIIYLYGTKDSDGSSLSYSDIQEGDIAVIAGPVRNYKGELEIEKGKVLAYYTPGVDTPVKPGTDPDDDNSGSGTDTPPENEGSGVIVWPSPDEPITSDPYVNVDKAAFYADYRPAVSYMDAYYRSLHYLMSGSIDDQYQAPTISDYRPMDGGKYVRNTTYLYSADGNTYYVVNAYGEVVNEIYRGGAYVILEEVAAYVFAFGEPPANHSSNKNAKPSSSQWGIYLRVNHTDFSGDTSRYPYEPVLPNISGCGGSLYYYEMDVGTTGTDCDPDYPCTDYNNGSTITRGAARIVYTRMDLDRDGVIEVNETFLFYTYNHYNDFQEYLNYEGGWGQMFGNITGGGSISSKYDYNPTSYPTTAYAAFVTTDSYTVMVFCLPKREEV